MGVESDIPASRGDCPLVFRPFLYLQLFITVQGFVNCLELALHFIDLLNNCTSLLLGDVVAIQHILDLKEVSNNIGCEGNPVFASPQLHTRFLSHTRTKFLLLLLPYLFLKFVLQLCDVCHLLRQDSSHLHFKAVVLLAQLSLDISLVLLELSNNLGLALFKSQAAVRTLLYLFTQQFFKVVKAYKVTG